MRVVARLGHDALDLPLASNNHARSTVVESIAPRLLRLACSAWNSS